jgi:hypothetical protein
MFVIARLVPLYISLSGISSISPIISGGGTEADTGGRDPIGAESVPTATDLALLLDGALALEAAVFFFLDAFGLVFLGSGGIWGSTVGSFFCSLRPASVAGVIESEELNEDTESESEPDEEAEESSFVLDAVAPGLDVFVDLVLDAAVFFFEDFFEDVFVTVFAMILSI